MADTKTIKKKKKSGFKFEVSEKTLDNMELVDAIASRRNRSCTTICVMTMVSYRSNPWAMKYWKFSKYSENKQKTD